MLCVQHACCKRWPGVEGRLAHRGLGSNDIADCWCTPIFDTTISFVSWWDFASSRQPRPHRPKAVLPLGEVAKRKYKKNSEQLTRGALLQTYVQGAHLMHCLHSSNSNFDSTGQRSSPRQLVLQQGHVKHANIIGVSSTRKLQLLQAWGWPTGGCN